MSYRYSRDRIHEIVSASKCVANAAAIVPERIGEHGIRCQTYLDLVDGPFVDLKFFGKGSRLNVPEHFDASLLLDCERVRGVGHCPVARHNFRAKRRIPAGWHQNICDPNVPTTHPEYNRHEPLPSFNPTDFKDFINKTADLWHVELLQEERLL